MRLEQVTDDIHRLRLGRINCYLVTRPSPVLVDCGLPAHASRVKQLMREAGVAPEDLEAILLTHRHLDHSGGVTALHHATNARVVVHAADCDAVHGTERLSPLRGAWNLVLGPLVALSDRRVFKFRPCPTAEAVTDGWEGHGMRLIHLPGHTQGHSGYVHLDSGVVLGGDAAMVQKGAPRLPSRLFSVDPIGVKRSLAHLADLQAPVYCFGHGRPLLNGADALRRLAG